MSNPLALIIEDNTLIAEVFSRTLQLAGFNTEVCADGAEALTRLNGTVPTFVILDLHLPKVPGKIVLDQILMDKRWAKTRVIVASGDIYMAETIRSIGVEVLPKPASPRMLLNLVSSLS